MCIRDRVRKAGVVRLRTIRQRDTLGQTLLAALFAFGREKPPPSQSTSLARSSDTSPNGQIVPRERGYACYSHSYPKVNPHSVYSHWPSANEGSLAT
eukprot:2042961-Pyramimonas_sp.AAC.2